MHKITPNMNLLILFGLLLAFVMPVLAQDDAPSINNITYGQLVEETITANAIFDWWRMQAAEGDQLSVEMAASGGLQPLLAILGPSGDAVSRSEDGAANATVRLNYTVPAAGQYTIVATRVGGPNGTSAGTYTLRLLRDNPTRVVADPARQVTFRCGEIETAAAATITFAEDPKPSLSHRVTVFGIDGFKPAVRVVFSASPEFEDCTVDARLSAGDTFTLPGETARTLTPDTLEDVSQVILGGAENMGTISLTIASRGGAPGRYMAVIEGFSIDRGDRDAVNVSIGPLAARTTALTVYMVGTPNSRLDPYIFRPDTEQSCDDAGRRGCEAIPSFVGAGYTQHRDDIVMITGDRNDAGVVLTSGSADPVTLELSSRGGDTYGDYALVLIGELPPRE